LFDGNFKMPKKYFFFSEKKPVQKYIFHSKDAAIDQILDLP